MIDRRRDATKLVLVFRRHALPPDLRPVMNVCSCREKKNRLLVKRGDHLLNHECPHIEAGITLT